eukprot:6768931-Alexandrium_andersonii.AAC.1
MELKIQRDATIEVCWLTNLPEQKLVVLRTPLQEVRQTTSSPTRRKFVEQRTSWRGDAEPQ